MTSVPHVGRCVVCVFAALVSAANARALQQKNIPVRALSAPIATDSGVFRAISYVRPLSDGRVLVLDALLRRLVIVEPSFKALKIVADTAPGAPNKLGAGVGAIIPYLGDSSVVVDMDVQALIVVDPSGRFGRALALPQTKDLRYITNSPGVTAFDPKGRLVYRGLKPTPRFSASAVEENARTVSNPSFADSAPIIRANFDTRSIDTIAMMRLPTQKIASYGNSSGRGSCFMQAFNPLPTTDEWALLPDGTIAVVRGQDYHIDWWDPSGTMTSTAKMPFDWKGINLEQREALLDSLRKADVARRAAAPAPPPVAPGQSACRPPFMTVDAVDMADYYPPIRAGQFRADRDGNVWVLPSTSTLSASGTSGLVWDVVSRKGEITERVKLPDGRNLAGFGPGGTVYMIYAPNPGRILLERAQIVR